MVWQSYSSYFLILLFCFRSVPFWFLLPVPILLLLLSLNLSPLNLYQ